MAGGALAGAAATTIESAVNTGGLPTGSQLANGAAIGAVAQNIAPAAQAVGSVAGAAMETAVGASSGAAQGAESAAVKVTEHAVENTINTVMDAGTRTPEASEPTNARSSVAVGPAHCKSAGS